MLLSSSIPTLVDQLSTVVPVAAAPSAPPVARVPYVSPFVVPSSPALAPPATVNPTPYIPPFVGTAQQPPAIVYSSPPVSHAPNTPAAPVSSSPPSSPAFPSAPKAPSPGVPGVTPPSIGYGYQPAPGAYSPTAGIGYNPTTTVNVPVTAPDSGVTTLPTVTTIAANLETHWKLAAGIGIAIVLALLIWRRT